MPVPRRYRCNTSSSEISYTSRVTHHLDPLRLVEGRDPYIKPNGADIEQNKRLIIHDWEAGSWNRHKQIVLAERLYALQQQGVEIYIYQEGGTLSKTDFSRYQNRMDGAYLGEMRDAHKGHCLNKQIIKEAVEQLRLSHDQVMVLDHHELALLIEGDDEDWAAYRTSDVVDLHESNISITSLTRMLKAKGNTLRSLNLVGCLNLDNGSLPLDLHLPALTELILGKDFFKEMAEEEIVTLNPESMRQLVKSSPELTHLDLSYCTQIDLDILDDIQHPEKIEILRLAHMPDSKNHLSLENFLSKAKHLRALNLNKHAYLSGNMLDSLEVDFLEELDLSDSDISALSLKKILSSAKKLKVLKLAEYQRFSDEMLEGLNLDSLEALDVSGSNIRAASLGQILAGAGKLKTLNLNRSKRLLDEILSEMKLDRLLTFSASDSNIRAASLSRILAGAGKLETLNLNGSKNLSDEILSEMTLDRLLTFIASNSNISAASLGKILAQASKLKNLNLSWCTNLSDEPRLSASASRSKRINLPSLDPPIPHDLHLDFLEDLNVSGSNISTASLGRILAGAVKLKTLNLRSCENLSGGMFDTLNLESLETLNASNSNISAASLGKILAGAVKLKTLNLSGCKNLSDGMFDTLNLESLETLDASDSNISAASLGKILAGTVKLKTLNLSGCENPSDGMFDTLNLGSLETLNASNSNISTASLGRILAGAGKLKTLNLNRCNNLSDGMFDTLNLGSLEKLDAIYSNISTASLGKILAGAKKLKDLTLNQCTNLSDEILSEMKLDRLLTFIASNSKISAASLGRILAGTGKLKKLALTNCEISDEILDDLNLESLEDLDLSGSNISTDALIQILAKAPNVRKIKLEYCKNLTGEIDELRLPDLQELSVAHSNISSSSINNIISSAKKNNREVTVSGMESLPYPIQKAPQASEASTLQSANASLFRSLEATAPLDFPDLPHPTSTGAGGSSWDPFRRAPQAPTGAASSSRGPPQPGAATRMPSAKKRTVDANTTQDPKTEFNLTQVFYGKSGKHPKVEHYRLETFNHIEADSEPCAMDEAFTLSNKGDAQFVDFIPERTDRDTYAHLLSLPNQQDKTYYYGKTSIILTREPQALPSLSAAEKFTQYHLSNPNVEVKFCYSKRDNLCYIYTTSEKPVAVEINFLLEVPHEAGAESLPADIQDKIKKFKKEFTSKDLEEFKKEMNHKGMEQPTGREYLKALGDQQVGACRHRSIVFKDWLVQNKKYDDSSVRIVQNDCHSFVELLYEGKWIRCDLGGYGAKLNIHQPHAPTLEKFQASRHDNPNPILEVLEQKSTDLPQQEPPQAAPPAPPKKRYFEPPKPQHRPATGEEYIDSLFSKDQQKNQLIYLEDSESVSALSLSLENYCAQKRRPYFYVHSAEDLSCCTPFIKLNTENNTGTTVQGPGGPLHDFLTKHKDDDPLIVVNYDNFTASEIVRFNTLLDIERKADGTPLPKNAVVIGLINPNKPGAYDGADFHSRFDTPPSECPLNKDAFHPALDVPVREEKQEEDIEPYMISLFGGSDWEAQLLGQWKLLGNKLEFVEGKLIEAIKLGATHIELNNAPWHDARFVHFWQQTLLHQTVKTRYAKEPLKLPEGFKLTQSNAYPWGAFAQYVEIPAIAAAENTLPALALNPSLLPRFLSTYTCDNAAGTLTMSDGLLAQHKESVLPIYVSAPLNTNAWARFLDACMKHKVKIQPICAPGVTLPAELNKDAPTLSTQTNPWLPGAAPASDFFIYSNDPDLTEKQFTEDGKVEIVMDVTEVDPGVLLKKINATFDKENLAFHFQEKTGVLLNALADNKRVVLTGTVQPDMADALNAFILQRRQQPDAKGQLIILSNQPNLMPALPSFAHEVTGADKKVLLAAQQPLRDIFSEDDYAQYALVQLQSMLAYHRRHPTEDKRNAWQGLVSLPESREMQDAFSLEEKLDLSEETANAFMQARMDLLETAVKTSPIVFVAGKTGVGKTTFMQSHWVEKHSNLHIGENAIGACLKDDRPGKKTIFIDEANISKRQWSEFEGLRKRPRGMLVGDEHIELPEPEEGKEDDYCAIFAGNPQSDGGERQLPSLLQRHACTIIFDPLPPAVLYRDKLLPILRELCIENEQEIERLATPFLNVMQFLTRCDPNKVLMSPRELGMMALLTVCYCKNNPETDPHQVAKHYAYRLGKDLVPETHQAAFETAFGNVPQLQKSAERERLDQKVGERLSLNEANQPALDALNDALDLRAMRQHAPEGSILAASSALGGVLIEGEPGVGKSQLVQEVLRARGFITSDEAARRDELGEAYDPSKVFYMLPASMPPFQKESLSLAAFHEAAIVVPEEINSAPMSERLLNNLLMGKDPQGKPAKKSGFTVIGTQNPATQAGRNRATAAQLRRLRNMSIRPYNQAELIVVLQKIRIDGLKGLSQEISADMVDAYLNSQKIAIKEGKEPLCLRDLIKRAEQEIRELHLRAAEQPSQAAAAEETVVGFKDENQRGSGSPNFFKEPKDQAQQHPVQASQEKKQASRK
jgi:hypothetical protein